LSTRKHQAAVARDVRQGQQAGVSATPTFFINGVRLTGAKPAAAFEAIIDRQLAALKDSKSKK
jgi:protein-disulfide isomerase